MWPLSVQQVTSCTDEVYGCGGGDTTLAYEQLASGVTKTGFATAGCGRDPAGVPRILLSRRSLRETVALASAPPPPP